MWNFPDLYISRTEGKFSGFLSKKYSGGSPGVYSSQSSKISSMLLDDINLPNLVLGYLTKLSLHPWNLVPPTSKIIYCLGLNSSTKHSSLSTYVGSHNVYLQHPSQHQQLPTGRPHDQGEADPLHRCTSAWHQKWEDSHHDAGWLNQWLSNCNIFQ